jgi:hypothetical protein
MYDWSAFQPYLWLSVKSYTPAELGIAEASGCRSLEGFGCPEISRALASRTVLAVGVNVPGMRIVGVSTIPGMKDHMKRVTMTHILAQGSAAHHTELETNRAATDQTAPMR